GILSSIVFPNKGLDSDHSCRKHGVEGGLLAECPRSHAQVDSTPGTRSGGSLWETRSAYSLRPKISKQSIAGRRHVAMYIAALSHDVKGTVFVFPLGIHGF